MKVLSLHQPYATLIAVGQKTIETRSWRAPASMIGQRFAVHAAQKRPADYWCRSNADPIYPSALFPLYDRGRCIDEQETADGEWWRYRWAGPLGCVVATARLADCVPMVVTPTYPHPCVILGSAFDQSPTMYFPYPRGVSAEDDGSRIIDDDVPFGDFRPGRFAWLLDEVQPLDTPIPFKGGQGLSRSWSPDA